MLAGGVNLLRDPHNGRNFEYISEDPLLSGIIAGDTVAGIQSNHIISTVKHFAFNGQETQRSFVNSLISDKNARESDLLAFQIAIERGQPGAGDVRLYTSFAYEGLRLTGGKRVTASFTLRNTGTREGADVPQLYLISAAGRKLQRQAGFAKLSLKPGEARQVTISVEPRILAE